MAAISIHTVMLACDGCAARLRDGEQFTSAADARGAAYGEGWRFPPRLSRSTGKPLTHAASDVCPTCLPTWEQQTTGTSGRGYQRHDGTVRLS
ncbi:hypothetical protein GA0115252_146434 [Streptomyces sp. DfronAA-171]|nr:hypothetical protein GA0115252_146434 [Streptomyces sp. DfronAA-171]